MGLHRRRAQGGCSTFRSLPDELCETVLRLVPMTSTHLLESAVVLKSRGPVERVCRRWRRYALQLPASLSVSLCELHEMELDAEEAEMLLEPVLPLISKRNITALSVSGCPESLPVALPSRLLCALSPQLLRLELCGSSLLHWTTFLMLCTRLEVLQIHLPELEEEAEHLLCSHLCGLRGRLQQLRLHGQSYLEMLESTVGRHVRPAELVMTAGNPAGVAWAPQLTRCTITVSLSEHLGTLASDLEATAASLSQLSSLTINDARPAAHRAAALPSLPGLADLPALRQLVCSGSVPQAAWACPHLTSLLLEGTNHAAGFGLPEGSAAGCTSLQQLRLTLCKLPGDAFPAALCPALRRLSSIAILNSNLSGGLPTAFSQLSSLQQLVIDPPRVCRWEEKQCCIKAASVQAFRHLSALTALHLPNCNLQGLPSGPYLSGLKSLDISGNPLLASPVPFALTAARGLRALSISGQGHGWQAADWLDLEWKLHSFPQLEVLYLDMGWLDDEEGFEEELQSFVHTGCFTFQLGEYDDQCKPRWPAQYSGLADFGGAGAGAN